jgi:heat shock protein HtpX
MTIPSKRADRRAARQPVDLGRRMADSRGLSAILFTLTVLSCLVAGALITGVVVLASYAVAAVFSLDVWKPTPVGAVQFVAVVGGLYALGCLTFLLWLLRRSTDVVLTGAAATTPDPLQFQRLTNTAAEVAAAAGIPAPSVVIVRSATPNALAAGSGPTRTTVGVTSGLLDLLDRQQLQAVVAHQVAHIVNGDVRYSTFLAAVFLSYQHATEWALGIEPDETLPREPRTDESSLWGWFGYVILPGLALSRLATLLAGLAAARQRELLADDGAVRLTRDPSALIDALEILAASGGSIGRHERGLAHLFILDPGEPRSGGGSFDSHPALEERLRRLRALVPSESGA